MWGSGHGDSGYRAWRQVDTVNKILVKSESFSVIVNTKFWYCTQMAHSTLCKTGSSERTHGCQWIEDTPFLVAAGVIDAASVVWMLQSSASESVRRSGMVGYMKAVWVTAAKRAAPVKQRMRLCTIPSRWGTPPLCPTSWWTSGSVGGGSL